MPFDGWEADGLPNAPRDPVPEPLVDDQPSAEVESLIAAETREDVLAEISGVVDVDDLVGEDDFRAFAGWWADRLMLTDHQRALLAAITFADVVAHQVELQRWKIRHARTHTAWHPRGRQAIREAQAELVRLRAPRVTAPERMDVPRAVSRARRPRRRAVHSSPRKTRAGDDDPHPELARGWRLAARAFGRWLEARVAAFVLRLLQGGAR